MRIVVTSVFVDDQDKALAFYTEVLGFVKKTEIPIGEHALADRRLARGPRRHRAAARAGRPSGGAARSRQALVEDGIPCTSFARRRRRTPSTSGSRPLGVRFTQPPLEMGPVTTAVLDDTCGNLIQIVSQQAR